MQKIARISKLVIEKNKADKFLIYDLLCTKNYLKKNILKKYRINRLT